MISGFNVELHDGDMSSFSSCPPSDPKLDAQRQRLSSGVGSDLFPGLEGLEVELGAYGKVRLNWRGRLRTICLCFVLVNMCISSSDGIVRPIPFPN